MQNVNQVTKFYSHVHYQTLRMYQASSEITFSYWTRNALQNSSRKSLAAFNQSTIRISRAIIANCKLVRRFCELVFVSGTVPTLQ